MFMEVGRISVCAPLWTNTAENGGTGSNHYQQRKSMSNTCCLHNIGLCWYYMHVHCVHVRVSLRAFYSYPVTRYTRTYRPFYSSGMGYSFPQQRATLAQLLWTYAPQYGHRRPVHVYKTRNSTEITSLSTTGRAYVSYMYEGMAVQLSQL